MKLKLLLLLFCSVLALPVVAQRPLVVGELSVHYPPFHMELSDTRRGIYADLMQAIVHRANIPHRTRYFTFKRLKRAYIKGDVPLNCCTHPAWWQDEGGVDPSLFSMPIMMIRDLWVFPRGYSFNPEQELEGKRVALIRAFGYRGVDEAKIERLDLDDAHALLDAVEQHQAEVGIVNEWVLLWEMKRHAYALDMPLEQDRVWVHLLVSPEARDLLPKINRAIESMRRSGEIDEIIRSYIPDYEPLELTSSN